METQANDAMFVIVSDMHLDRPQVPGLPGVCVHTCEFAGIRQVVEKLRKMFKGFSEVSPLPLFILIGNFTSRPTSFGRCLLFNLQPAVLASLTRLCNREGRCPAASWALQEPCCTDLGVSGPCHGRTLCHCPGTSRPWRRQHTSTSTGQALLSSFRCPAHPSNMRNMCTQLASKFSDLLKEKVKNAYFATNPCRYLRTEFPQPRSL